ncbi:MAG: hypothetical protein ACPGUC_09735, partial [Gammaproteobacteria bacterium]
MAPLALSLVAPGTPARADKCSTLDPIYNTKGVHNSCYCDGAPDGEGCIEQRAKSDPPDPIYPDHWISQWTMYRVFDNF